MTDIDELWAQEREAYMATKAEHDGLQAEVNRLTAVNEDWMQYTIRLLRDIERLREENRSLMQTVRRVLRGSPVET